MAVMLCVLDLIMIDYMLILMLIIISINTNSMNKRKRKTNHTKISRRLYLHHHKVTVSPVIFFCVEEVINT